MPGIELPGGDTMVIEMDAVLAFPRFQWREVISQAKTTKSVWEVEKIGGAHGRNT